MKIRADLTYLGELQTQVESSRTDLDADDHTYSGTPSDSRVDERLGKFSGDWDQRRGELSDSLETVTVVLTAIIDSFSGTDAAMADSLLAEANS